MSKKFNPDLIDFEYDLMPNESMEWHTLEPEQNKDINDTLKQSFRDNYPMAIRFYKILTKGDSAKYHQGHMIRLNRDYLNRILETGVLK